ncbi:hypothetical protein F5Y03DRAFT_397697 [Xylaria venustula]|nr:hypothetical protein F5Y03DRAFT_397697 [Xylaria venustula]
MATYLYIPNARTSSSPRTRLIDMTSYRFGTGKKPHKFCPTCGTSILINFSESDLEIDREVTAVNIRTFVEIEELMSDLEFKPVDGKNKLGPAYSVVNA